jgi:resuscitation-promoting factor RpfA
VLTADKTLYSGGPAADPAAGPAADPVTAQPAAPALAASSAGSVPGGSFGQCVVSRESGGNAQVMNSSGHYGLFQFSASTWTEYGGDPADFGNASAAQQIAVFQTAMNSPGGEGNWAPYDGC